MTEAGRTFGTPAYMSPEQIRAADLEAEVGPATDVYALCATYYELFTNTRLYDHDTENMETIKTLKLAGQRPVKPQLSAKGLPWELETILMGGLEPDLGDRYRAMEDLKRDIDHYLADEPIEYRRPSLWRRARLGYRRNRTVANLVGVFLLVAVAGTTFYIVQITESEKRTAHELAAARIEQGSKDCSAGRRGRGLQTLLRAYQTVDTDDPISGSARRLIGAWSRSIGLPLVHDDTVVAVAISQDGGRALCLTASHRARLWDARNARPIGEPLTHAAPKGVAPSAPQENWYDQAPPETGVRSIVLSGNGKRAVTHGGGWTRLWDGDTGKPVGAPLDHEGVQAITVSRDSAIVVTGGEDKTARIWSGRTGKLLGTLDHGSAVISVAASDDGRRIVTGCREGGARLWHRESGTSVDLKLEGYVDRVAISGDGLLAVCRGSGGVGLIDAQSGTVKLISWSGLQKREPGDTVPKAPDSIGISRDGTTFLLRDGDHVQLFDAKSQKPRGTRMRGTLAAIADGAFVVTGSEDGDARFWDGSTGRQLGVPIVYQRAVRAIAISAGTVAIGEDNLVRLWDAREARPASAPDDIRRMQLKTQYGRYNPGSLVVALSANGAHAIGGVLEWNSWARRNVRAAFAWDVATGKIGNTVRRGYTKRHRFGVMQDQRFVAVGVSDDGQTVIFSEENWTAWIWNIKAGKWSPQLKHREHIGVVAISRDGSVAITGSHDATAKAWKGSTGEQIGKPWKHGGPVLAVAINADGSRAITGSSDGTARIWEARTGKALFELKHLRAVVRVGISADGTRAVTRSGPEVQVWNARTGRPEGRPHHHPVRHSEYNPRLPPAKQKAFGGVVALSPDGATLFTARQKYYRLWDVATGEPLGPSVGSSYWVADLVVTADHAISADLGLQVVRRAPPRPARDDPKRLRLSIETRTGLHWKEGLIARLTHAEWWSRRRALDRLGGPCDVVR